MSEHSVRYSMLDRFYQQYLTDENTARYLQQVSDRYTLPTLERLAHTGNRMTRRAAVLAVGFLGDFAQNETLGRALVDRDRAVRLLADLNIRRIWFRQGRVGHRALLVQLEQWNLVDRPDDVIDHATDLLRYDGGIGEAWNQRAIAWSSLGEYGRAVADCRETLNCNRYHFVAAVGMGQCCMELEDRQSALECFRLALTINPDLEGLRGQIRHLEKILGRGL